MLEREDFKIEGEKVLAWIDQFYKKLKNLPVKSQVKPGEIYDQIPKSMPLEGCGIDELLKDTSEIILPGITHWQHPNFHAYFPANSSIASTLGEIITAALGAQCMIWETSPAAAELEERMMEWLRDAMNLPHSWEGVIQDTASSATLVALICARERATNFTSNEEGVPNHLRIYCSSQTHSSIEKGAVIAGIGRKNVIKIGSGLTLDANELSRQIELDISNGKKPCAVIVAIGTTGTVAVDDLKAIAPICEKHDIWLHIDAAYAGSALLLPEYQWMMEGGDTADSFVFNPHKWLFTNFDCTAYFVKDVDLLVKTFEILPEYLKTNTRGQVNDYRDWGVALGRRFRALKLWYVLRSYGLKGLQSKLREHIALTEYFCKEIVSTNFEVMVGPFLNFCCIRYIGPNNCDDLNEANKVLKDTINREGKAYLTHTMVDQDYVLRVVIAQTYVNLNDINDLIDILRTNAQKI